MAFVLDASVTACWVFDDEAHLGAEAALELVRREGAVAPWLWWFEVRNILVVQERRGRIRERASEGFLAELARLPVRLDAHPREEAVLELARRHRLTVYDAAYLELAVRERLPMATLDEALRAAARAEGVGLVG